jgi:phosphoenolpyruvate-protein phosphotransferase
MIRLGQEDVCLNAAVKTKTDAIRQAGELLVQSGHIQSGYVESMLAREEAANTYLGNGIAIPHGLPENRELILETGISVTQVPEGVEWNPGETVYLVVGIAAKSDEHLDILRNLTHVLDDEATVHRLAHTDDPREIVQRLTQPRTEGATAQPTTPDFEKFVDVQVQGATGLHARPATVFVNIAKSFTSEIRVRHQAQIANGKSLVSLLKLGVEQGQTLRIMAEGEDADAALQALQEAVEAGLEDEEEVATEAMVTELPALVLETPAIAGVAASPGLAIAPLYQFRQQTLTFEETASDPTAEAQRLQASIHTAQGELQDLYETVKQRAGSGKAAIFQAHQEFLNDAELIEDAIARMGTDRSAAWAWQQAIEERARSLEALRDPTLAARATDLRDVGQRVLRQIVGQGNSAVDLPDHPVILVAPDLTPSDTASLDPNRIKGFCTVGGGPTSHAAIMARSLSIPAVVGAGEDILMAANETSAILDGDRGELYLNPTAADLEKARQAQTERQALRDVAQQRRYEPAITPDGHRVEVVANIGAPTEAEAAVNAGGEGVGLLRTEFLFLGRSQPPTEDEQVQALQQMTHALGGLPLIVRTLDIGGDKEVPYLNLPKEENPFLGVRGIRLCLQQQDLFETQLRAIFRAAQTGYLRIMFPMVATLEELRAAKTVVESVRSQLNAPPLEIGMMVEVPSVVMMAMEFAPEVDFFSVGTNDLTQYLLAMDRGHPTLAKQADALHPAVLRAIYQTVQAAESAGKWVGVCGGIASDPLGAAILTGLGVIELSVDIPSIPAIKDRVRRLSRQKMQRLAQRALRCRTAEEVRQL